MIRDEKAKRVPKKKKKKNQEKIVDLFW